MRRVQSIVLLCILVVVPMLPMFMVPATNADPNTPLNDISEEIVDVGLGTPDTLPEGDVELNMMFFTETPSSEDGLYYVCRRGTDSFAYFGASKVLYLSEGVVFTLEFPGSNEVIPQGENPTGSVTNYLLGNDPSKWNTDIADCFVTKLAADGKSLIYSTFLSGKLSDVGYGIAVESGSAYITGKTNSPDYHTNNAFGTTVNGNYDCFVAKLAMDGGSLLYSTYLGGTDFDFGRGVAVVNDTVYITGYTGSSEFPTTVDAYNSTLSGGYDCFISIFSQDSDSDSLSDWQESYLGTDPLCIDSDNDNFLDAYEVAYGSDPLDPSSTPAMPQSWYDDIYEDLDGNATLLTQVISWLDGNHTAIETLFNFVEGNATLLLETVDALDGNATRLGLVAALATDNTDWLQTLNSTVIGNVTEIREVLDQLGITVGDLDCDGLDDLDELGYGTDIDCVDSDNLLDGFEISIGTDPLSADTDLDNYLDGIEIIAGSDPLDPLSYPGSEVLPDYTLVIVVGAFGVVVIVGFLYRKRGG